MTSTQNDTSALYLLHTDQGYAGYDGFAEFRSNLPKRSAVAYEAFAEAIADGQKFVADGQCTQFTVENR